MSVPSKFPWLAVLLAATACAGGDQRPRPQIDAQTDEQIDEQTDATNPLLDARAVDATESSFHGRVAERLGAGSYSYLEIETAQERRWVATMGRGVDVGLQVRVRAYSALDDFESRRLDRTFDRVYFGTITPTENHQ